MVVEPTNADINWVILFEGMLARVYKLDHLVGQMLAYTARSRINEFRILSGILRASSARANQAISDAHSEQNRPLIRRPDSESMVAQLWSPEGWNKFYPPLPWVLNPENCPHVTNSVQYTNTCRAVDKGPALKCYYKNCEDCGSVFIRVEAHQPWVRFGHREHPGAKRKPESAPAQVRPASQRAGRASDQYYASQHRTNIFPETGASSSTSHQPVTLAQPRAPTAEAQARMAAMMARQGVALAPLTPQAQPAPPPPPAPAQPFLFGLPFQPTIVAPTVVAGNGSGSDAPMSMTTPQRYSMGTPPRVQESLEEQRVQLEAQRLHLVQQQEAMSQQGNDWVQAQMQAQQAALQARAVEHQHVLEEAHRTRMAELELQATQFAQAQQQAQQQQAFSQQVQQQQQLAQQQQQQQQQQEQQLMQQQYLQMQAAQAIQSGGSPPSAPILLHADTFQSAGTAAHQVPTPEDRSSEEGEYIFRQ